MAKSDAPNDSCNRLACVLKNPGIKDAVASMADRNELTHLRSFQSVNAVVAEKLSEPLPVNTESLFPDRPFTEAIILEKTRPVLLVRDGRYDVARLPEIERAIGPHRDALARRIDAVGRLELGQHDTLGWCGTGWLLEDNLVVTNRHVAELFAQESGRSFRFRRNQRGQVVSARIDFREEYRVAQSNEFGIAEVLWMAQNSDTAPDLAVLKLKASEGLPEPLEIAEKDSAAGQWIGVVGYPAFDDRNASAPMLEIFENIFEVKRFAPGQVVKSSKGVWYLTHEATTLGGNSGSAVLDLESGKVAGLHFGGSFRETNYAVKASMIRKIIARRSWVPVTKDELSIETEAFRDAKRTVEDLEGRKGYDSGFLGPRRLVDLPKPGRSHKILDVPFDDNALPYTHFSIVMSARRRLAIFTAENLDGELKHTLKRVDRWGYDPRIPQGQQVGHHDFYGPQPFDKGHLVRRENPAWGKTTKKAQMGQDDSFVYTNAAPQMPGLNQKTWLALEDYVLQNSKTHGFRVCIFTGPIFRPEDPDHGGVLVPLEYWKVVVALDARNEELLSSGYLLSQESLMPTESFRYGAFRTYQVPLSHIETEADLVFPAAVRKADVFAESEAETLAASSRFLEIQGPDDVVLAKAHRGR